MASDTAPRSKARKGLDIYTTAVHDGRATVSIDTPGLVITMDGRYLSAGGASALSAKHIELTTETGKIELIDLGRGLMKRVEIDCAGNRTDEVLSGDVASIANQILGSGC
jgi:hypothetical protein